MSEPIQRGNYDSGESFVLEYGEQLYTFNEQDFRERTEHAALELKFIRAKLNDSEQADLVSLTVEGGIMKPQSPLGEHVAAQDEAVLQNWPGSPGLVHWLRRIVLRNAWLDQRVKEGELDIEFIPETGDFEYVSLRNSLRTPIETQPAPSWEAVAYRGAPGP